jgi:hypothetical protein
MCCAAILAADITPGDAGAMTDAVNHLPSYGLTNHF